MKQSTINDIIDHINNEYLAKVLWCIENRMDYKLFMDEANEQIAALETLTGGIYLFDDNLKLYKV